MEPTPYRTEPVSFTRRGGRLTERQQAAWDAMSSTYVLDVPRHGPSTSVDPSFVLDPHAVFGRTAPLVVEIGSGRGEALVHAAAEHPDLDFLGLEVYVPGVAQTLVTMRHVGVTNVRLLVVNAAEALTTMLPPASVHELRVWFPDPWHKKRHHKRRLVTPEFARLAVRVLEPRGVWRLATDWEDYAEQIRSVVADSPDFDGGEWGPRFEGRPQTRFEGKGLDVGRTIRDITAVRRATHRMNGMTETSNAEKLRIGDGFVVWVIGASVEETSLLDPLPEGAETIEVRDEDEPESVDAAIMITDNRTALADDFDEVLPQLGSIPVVWITYPLNGHSDLDEDTLQDLLADFGWHAVESIVLDETWAAMRIVQS